MKHVRQLVSFSFTTPEARARFEKARIGRPAWAVIAEERARVALEQGRVRVTPSGFIVIPADAPDGAVHEAGRGVRWRLVNDAFRIETTPPPSPRDAAVHHAIAAMKRAERTR